MADEDPTHVEAGEWGDEEWRAAARKQPQERSAEENELFNAGPRQHPFARTVKGRVGGKSYFFRDKEARDELKAELEEDEEHRAEAVPTPRGNKTMERNSGDPRPDPVLPPGQASVQNAVPGTARGQPGVEVGQVPEDGSAKRRRGG